MKEDNDYNKLYSELESLSEFSLPSPQNEDLSFLSRIFKPFCNLQNPSNQECLRCLYYELNLFYYKYISNENDSQPLGTLMNNLSIPTSGESSEALPFTANVGFNNLDTTIVPPPGGYSGSSTQMLPHNENYSTGLLNNGQDTNKEFNSPYQSNQNPLYHLKENNVGSPSVILLNNGYYICGNILGNNLMSPLNQYSESSLPDIDSPNVPVSPINQSAGVSLLNNPFNTHESIFSEYIGTSVNDTNILNNFNNNVVLNNNVTDNLPQNSLKDSTATSIPNGTSDPLLFLKNNGVSPPVNNVNNTNEKCNLTNYVILNNNQLNNSPQQLNERVFMNNVYPSPVVNIDALNLPLNNGGNIIGNNLMSPLNQYSESSLPDIDSPNVPVSPINQSAGVSLLNNPFNTHESIFSEYIGDLSPKSNIGNLSNTHVKDMNVYSNPDILNNESLSSGPMVSEDGQSINQEDINDILDEFFNYN